MTDPISDMLTRIRNNLAVKKTEVVLPYSKIKFDIAKILEKENRIEGIKIIKSISGEKKKPITNFKRLNLILKYNEAGRPAISGLKRISSPGQRIYVKKDKIPYVLNGLGMTILSTSQGLMTGRQARKENLGGELICKIW